MATTRFGTFDELMADTEEAMPPIAWRLTPRPHRRSAHWSRLPSWNV